MTNFFIAVNMLTKKYERCSGRHWTFLLVVKSLPQYWKTLVSLLLCNLCICVRHCSGGLLPGLQIALNCDSPSCSVHIVHISPSLLCAHCAHFSFVAMCTLCTFLFRCYVHIVQRYYYAHHCKILGTGYSGYWALQSTGYWILGKWVLQSIASCWLFLLRGLRLFPTDCP